jgi:hypothetical protein
VGGSEIRFILAATSSSGFPNQTGLRTQDTSNLMILVWFGSEVRFADARKEESEFLNDHTSAEETFMWLSYVNVGRLRSAHVFSPTLGESHNAA